MKREETQEVYAKIVKVGDGEDDPGERYDDPYCKMTEKRNSLLYLLKRKFLEDDKDT